MCNILQFYENIVAQSSISRKNTKMKVKLCKVYTIECQQGDEICFRYNKIREFDTLERQTMGVNKYANTFPMASCNKKSSNHRKRKRGVKKYMKIRNCFASMQLRITRLRKYPIDPKAYLGRCLPTTINVNSNPFLTDFL